MENPHDVGQPCSQFVTQPAQARRLGAMMLFVLLAQACEPHGDGTNGCAWKNDHIMALASISVVDLPKPGMTIAGPPGQA